MEPPAPEPPTAAPSTVAPPAQELPTGFGEVSPPMPKSPNEYCGKEYFYTPGWLYAKNEQRDLRRDQNPPNIDRSGRIISIQRSSCKGTLPCNTDAIQQMIPDAKNTNEQASMCNGNWMAPLDSRQSLYIAPPVDLAFAPGDNMR